MSGIERDATVHHSVILVKRSEDENPVLLKELEIERKRRKRRSGSSAKGAKDDKGEVGFKDDESYVAKMRKGYL
jgi:uncharacterized short protein YbdD (DUF466 family)